MTTLEEVKGTYKIQHLRGTDKYRIVLPNGEYYTSPILELLGLTRDYTPVTLERAHQIVNEMAMQDFSSDDANWENVND